MKKRNSKGNIRRKVLVVGGFLATLFVITAVSVGVTANVVKNSQANAPKPPNPYDMWLLTNQYRVKNGLQPLLLDPLLTQVANNRCADMVKQNYYDHINPEGKTPQDFINELEPAWRYSGENLAGKGTSADAVNAWIASPEHRVNLLFHYTRVGFAVCDYDHGGFTEVQDFTDL